MVCDRKHASWPMKWLHHQRCWLAQALPSTKWSVIGVIGQVHRPWVYGKTSHSVDHESRQTAYLDFSRTL